MSGKKENERIRNKVLRMRAKFVDEVEPKDVLDLLIQESIVNKDRREKIMNQETRKDRCRALLDFLEDCSNEKAFITLREALQEPYHWIVERIDTPDAGNDNEDESRVEQLQKELDELKMEFQREVEDLKRESQAIKNELKEAKREIKILKMERQIQIQSRYDEHCNRKRSLTSAVDNFFRKKKCVSCGESSNGFESCLIILGTSNNKEFCKNLIKINLHITNEVSTIGQLPLPVNRDSAADVYDNSLFFTGLGENCDQIWKFDARSSSWECCKTLIRGRRGHCVAFLGHFLYVCGGWVKDGEIAVDDVEAYDAIDDRCTTVGKLVHPVHSSGNCVPFKSSLYIFGGCDSKEKHVNYVQVYDTKLNSCTLLPSGMPLADNLLRAVLWKNKVILLGCSNCFIYNFDTGIWKIRSQFKTLCLSFGTALHDGKLFVIGGGEITTDFAGKGKWTVRNDVRYLPVANVLSGESIEWRHHSKLPDPSWVLALGKLRFQIK